MFGEQLAQEMCFEERGNNTKTTIAVPKIRTFLEISRGISAGLCDCWLSISKGDDGYLPARK